MKIASFNLCLGLWNKIDLARYWIRDMDLDILLLYETEITYEMDLDILKIDGYTLVLKPPSAVDKIRTVAYVRNRLCTRTSVDEVTQSITIRVNGLAIIGFYRQFGDGQKQQINALKEIVERINEEKIVILGDFNWNIEKSSSKLCELWQNFTLDIGLTQRIKEPTWKRIINGNLKQSTLDHLYTNLGDELEWTLEDLCVGDHLAIVASINKNKIATKRCEELTVIRDWRKYSTNGVIDRLNATDLMPFQYMQPNMCSDYLDIMLTNVLDDLAPEIRLRKKEQSIYWSSNLIRLKRKKKQSVEESKKKI